MGAEKPAANVVIRHHRDRRKRALDPSESLEMSVRPRTVRSPEDSQGSGYQGIGTRHLGWTPKSKGLARFPVGSEPAQRTLQSDRPCLVEDAGNRILHKLVLGTRSNCGRTKFPNHVAASPFWERRFFSRHWNFDKAFFPPGQAHDSLSSSCWVQLTFSSFLALLSSRFFLGLAAKQPGQSDCKRRGSLGIGKHVSAQAIGLWIR